MLLRANKAVPRRNIGGWSKAFEQYHNVKLGELEPQHDRCEVFFNSEQDYTMFMLRWA